MLLQQRGCRRCRGCRRGGGRRRRHRYRSLGAAAGLLRRGRQWRHLPELWRRLVPAAIRGLPGDLYRREPTQVIVKTEPRAQRKSMTPGNLLRYRLTVLTFAVAIFAGLSVSAQQINGTPGSPSATQVIKGNQIPAPPLPFGGVIKESYKDSKSYWQPTVVPPKDAPNILLIMTDDAGYGVSSTFGGVIPTPTMDRIAKAGLRYTQFHTTALCSPTRAALITGRNHHSSGFGVISEQATGFPGYDSVIPPEKATIGAVLNGNGYATSWFGKNHNTPSYQYSLAGPFDQWPSGMRFDYFYGFMRRETEQWAPNLFRNTTQIYPFDGKPGWNLVTGMANDAIDYLNRVNQVDPSKPFFCSYVTG